MKQTHAGLNRFWLAFIGLVLIIGAAALIAATTGALGAVVPAAPSAENGSPVLGFDPTATAAAPALQGGLVAAGVLLAVLGLAWLAAQVPRRRRAGAYRLHAPDDSGRVTVDPTTLEAALDADVEQLPDVSRARSVLRGSASEPDVTIRATLSHRAPVADIVTGIRHGAVERLASSLEAVPRTVAIIIDVTTSTSRTRNVTQ